MERERERERERHTHTHTHTHTLAKTEERTKVAMNEDIKPAALAALALNFTNCIFPCIPLRPRYHSASLCM